ncbi:MAG: RNA polymerase sigma factor [Opitutaceae bacterium]|nr:RNA polymerase sigma factor [Opitutaceae bacterium]
MPAAGIPQWYADEVQPHESMLRAWLTSRFPGVADAEDVVQEAVLRVLRARENGAVLSAKALLFVAGRNLALNRLRDRERKPTEPLGDLDLGGVLDEHEDIRETVARLEEFRVLIDAIQALPERCRQVITLRRIYGLPQKEVAARLGISEHTVETQSAIGLDKCAEFFRARGHFSRSP